MILAGQADIDGVEQALYLDFRPQVDGRADNQVVAPIAQNRVVITATFRHKAQHGAWRLLMHGTQ
ncbi:hypothetical protein D3C73_1591310 [compost metagenome]